jgi:hypothetical protein
VLKRTAERPVFVDGQPKGVVYKLANRWRWRRKVDGIGTDSYARGATLEDVKAHIARVCNGREVIINKESK